MADSYDYADSYDLDDGYDEGGPTIVPATLSTMFRLRTSKAVANENTARAKWLASIRRESTIRLAQDKPTPAANYFIAPWQLQAHRSSDTRVRFLAGALRESFVRAKWSGVAANSNHTRITSADAAKHESSIDRFPWDGLAAHSADTSLRWNDGSPRSNDVDLPWARVDGKSSYVRIRWRPGYPYRSGYTIPFGGEPDLPPGTTIEIPSADAYFMIPALTITRDSDGADLDAIDASIKLDANSYAWTLDATIPRQSLGLVDPASHTDPVQVVANVNGYQWAFIIEGYTDNRKFGGTGCKIRGRSQSALLGAPYAPLSTFTNTLAADASQLAADLMPFGWTLTWSTQDWLVPAGLFSYADLAPIDALALLVNAVGAVIVPDQMNQTLTVQSLYPTSPWSWDTASPYADIPSSFFVGIDGQWVGNFKTAYNGIYVSGQNSGVVGLVKLTGTAGDVLLPTVTDNLLCVQAANVERGRVELAKSSAHKTETFRALLLPPGGTGNPGVFPVCSLVQVTEPTAWASAAWRAQAMSIAIDAVKSAAPNSAINVRQTLTLERHD